MRRLALGLLIGCLSALFLTTLPLKGWSIFFLLLGLSGFAYSLIQTRLQSFLIIFSTALIGFGYSAFSAHHLLDQRIPSSWEGQDIEVVGQVIDLPAFDGRSTRFVLDVYTAKPVNTKLPTHQLGRIKLTGYQTKTLAVQAGEVWQLRIRAKRPTGFINQHGFDYERWLATERISATGYVRDSHFNQRLDTASIFNIDAIRARIKEALAHTLPDSSVLGLLQGLAIADQEHINTEQWELLRNTGTIHLLAISGLHIAMVAWLGFVPVWLIGWLYPSLWERIPAQVLAGVLGAVFATGYSLLAGFNIPTQRTLIMILVVVWLLTRRTRLPWSRILATALSAVLLFDPLAPLTTGFWLSFGAVTLLVLLAQREAQPSRWLWLRLQIGIALCMIPLTAGFFGMVSWVSPLANLIAVPLVTVLVVPLLLVGLLLYPLGWSIGVYLWLMAEIAVQYLMQLLEYLSALPWAAQFLSAAPWYWLAGAGVGVLLLIMPRGMVGRGLGLILIIPLFSYQPPRPDWGEFRLSVLDVGQGSAQVIQTQHHILVVDTGARLDEFDLGKLVVVPWLQAQGVQHLDKLLITHADNDHSGGAEAVLAVYPKAVLQTNALELFPHHPAESCYMGANWVWEGVRFEVLSPEPDDTATGNNDLSCVLKVSNAHHSVLLAADAEGLAEQRMLRRWGKGLGSEVLVVGHHGSKSSSSAEFLQAVQPKLALISSGYRNRYQHPHAEVLKRLEERGIVYFNTAGGGELRVSVPNGAVPLVVWEERERQRVWWRRD
ncbi:MAG: DNA internalization-related competence protein ComEC/Rec2 [Thiofilum sp.]|uniref:DNA internalization-related competence protein ComEC/Rec2 n=1 Tax=Thiofilum sp. TaxID=2212733 RepID=UPI0025CD68BD|nr:DNA internalization-related competence protein ComEC/Rec2 [Thiofilum sp.]MBK8454219.1 DNA internalization-related competence protein ComEC/Rec2 [Thiofilum sp.]